MEIIVASPDQDDVARKLTQTNIEQMHEVMWVYGNSVDASWHAIIRSPATVYLLRTNGWDIKDYINECDGVPYYTRHSHMCMFFADARGFYGC